MPCTFCGSWSHALSACPLRKAARNALQPAYTTPTTDLTPRSDARAKLLAKEPPRAPAGR